MKNMLPSLRERKRYLVFEVLAEKKFNLKNISEALDQNFRQFLGELLLSRARPNILSNKWNSEKQKGIIRLNHNYVDHLKAGMSLVKKIDNQKAIVKSVLVSGTLKKACEVI